MSSSEAAMNKQKEDQEKAAYQELDIGEFKLEIKPRCLTFEPKLITNLLPIRLMALCYHAVG